jgi:AcrR family transcriptional regulator
MSAIIKVELNENIYLRDPESTDLGRKIISEAIRLIDELGFEHFTFKKLATAIESTEASIYRYFENKHKLLIYLISWYWAWLDYQVSFHTNNIHDPREKLKITIRVLSEMNRTVSINSSVDEAALFRIAVSEASKAYLTKEVDEDNRVGLFRDYKMLCRRIGEIVLQINPDYPYPHALVSTMFEGARKHLFFAQHLPSLTEVKNNDMNTLVSFLEHLIFSAIDSSSLTGKGSK